VFTRHQVVLLDEAEKRGILIRHARDGDALSHGTGQQRGGLVPGDLTVGRRDRVAVRVDLRTAEHVVDALDESFRHHVFELLGLVMHLVPT